VPSARRGSRLDSTGHTGLTVDGSLDALDSIARYYREGRLLAAAAIGRRR